MGFLGKIGIDWHLIAAQIVNFAILLWFLQRFFYKPLLKGMEHSDLEEAERQMEVVRQGQEKLKQEKEKALNELKLRSSELVAGAEKVAEDIKKAARQKAEEQKSKILAQAESLVLLQKGAAAAAAQAESRRRLAAEFADAWKKRLADAKSGRELQSVYYRELLASLGHLTASDAGAAGAEFVLESALPADKGENEDLRRTLAAQLKRDKIDLKFKRNKDLISGFRLVLGGLEVDNNMLADIRHASGQE